MPMLWPRRRSAAKSFAANGGSNAAPSLTTWKKLVIHRSASTEGSSRVKISAHHQRRRTAQRGIPPQDQNPDPCAETVPMLLWALLPSDQVRKVDGWANLSRSIRVLNLALAV